jgi:deazaflavin-dependent oxidoreductase (nitroreductase family)
MSTEQRVEQVWATPTEDEIPTISKMHVQALESSDADVVWVQAGMHHVVVETVGRKSGKVHKVALPYWRDPEGARVVVASFAGATANPAWFANLADRNANPRVRCRIQNGAFWSEPEILEGEEHARIWKLLNEDRAWYDDYQAKTDRTIPLVRLHETEPITD